MDRQPVCSTPAALGLAIRDQRKRKALSQTAVGALVGIDQATISAIERGAPSTKLSTLMRVFAALDLDLTLAVRNTKLRDQEIW